MMTIEQPVKRPRGRPPKPKKPRGRPKKIPEQQVDISERVVTEQEVLEPVSAPTPAAPLKVHIYPSFGEQDKGDGGIRRVVEGQSKHLHKFGIEIVPTAEEADVIAAHATIPSTYVRLYPQKPIVAMCHGLYWSEYEWDNWALKANEQVLENIRVSDSVTACSEWVANAIRRHTSRPVHVINHGIDIEEWGADDPKDYVLWNKTRPDPVCDPEPVNQVATLLPNVKFISTFGNDAPNVALTGRLEFDKAKVLIQRAGVYLCTARETFGIGTLEALASGVPVVGFNWGGQSEFIEHGKDGWLVTPGDIPALAEGIKWALDNREELRDNCRAKAAQFTWERAAEQYAEVFREAHSIKTKVAPRTSVIVTAYKLEQLLPVTLDSVYNQSDQDWECIIVDDASPDSCGEIAEHFAAKDSRFRVIHNKDNVYLAEARNTGIRAAKGRYILPLDADDMLATGAVSVLADSLDQDRSINVAYGNVLFIEEDGETLKDFGRYNNDGPGHSHWPIPFSYEQQIQKMNLLPYCSMFRKEAWENVGGYRRRCRTAEDADFWTRLSSYGFKPKMVTSEDTLIYRVREKSMSSEQGDVDWTQWFTWSKVKEITPAGAATQEQLPVSSLDPIVISVVIPVGPGHERWIMDAVDSVDAQTFRNWECVVVNDTGKPFEFSFPSWVRILETEGKTGPAHARNVGIRASKGKLFLPLDADDYLQPEALQFMYNAYRESHEVVYSDFWQDVGDGGMSVHHCDDYNPQFIKGGKRIVEGESRSGMMHSVTALTPKEYWNKIGGYDEKLPAWEDWDFQIALGNIGVCSRRVAAPLFFYRKHTGFRREENFESFERSKEGIFSKWKHIWEGGKELMACGSCGGKGKTYNPMGSNWAAPRTSTVPGSGEAVMVQYIGEKTGATPYRGPSKTTYWFAKGDKKWVLEQDLTLFRKYINDFQILQEETVDLTSPVLVAEGPPQR